MHLIYQRLRYYFIAACGGVTLGILWKYIENQDHP